MRAIVVDDQALSLEILQVQLESLKYFDDIQCFTDPAEAVEYVKTNRIDIAFLDIVMDQVDGLTLAGAIRAYIPGCYIIFTTASSEYALDAFKIHASGYLVKPVTREQLREQLNAIEIHQVQPAPIPAAAPAAVPEKPLRVQCFGNFEAFDSTGRPLTFRYKKSKELLAYLVHRKGAVCSNAEIAAVLYEDRDDSKSLQSQIRNLVSDLSRTLRESNSYAALYREHGGTAVIPDEIDCDYYDYMRDGAAASYHGEYMTQYDWAEPVNAYLQSHQ